MNRYESGTPAKNIPDGYYWEVFESGNREIVKVYCGEIYDCVNGQYDADSEISSWVKYLEGPITHESMGAEA